MNRNDMSEEISKRRKRLLYRANYRGFKEADLLFGGFAKAHLSEMDEAELDEFEELLKLPDRELYEWATGKTEPPANIHGPVFSRLQKFSLV